MSTRYQGVKAYVESLAGEVWIEEILIRGQRGGGVKGSHLVLGYAAPGVGGDVIGVDGPHPLTALTADPAFAEACSLIDIGSLQSVNDLTSQVEQLTKERDAAISAHNSLAAQYNSLSALKTELAEKLSAAEAIIASPKEQYNALLAQVQQQNGGE